MLSPRKKSSWHKNKFGIKNTKSFPNLNHNIKLTFTKSDPSITTNKENFNILHTKRKIQTEVHLQETLEICSHLQPTLKKYEDTFNKDITLNNETNRDFLNKFLHIGDSLKSNYFQSFLVYPLELKPLLNLADLRSTNSHMRNSNYYELHPSHVNANISQNIDYPESPTDGSHTSQYSIEETNADVYRSFLGPTPDESILAGLQTVIEMVGSRNLHPYTQTSCNSRLSRNILSDERKTRNKIAEISYYQQGNKLYDSDRCEPRIKDKTPYYGKSHLFTFPEQSFYEPKGAHSINGLRNYAQETSADEFYEQESPSKVLGNELNNGDSFHNEQERYKNIKGKKQETIQKEIKRHVCASCNKYNKNEEEIISERFNSEVNRFKNKRDKHKETIDRNYTAAQVIADVQPYKDYKKDKDKAKAKANAENKVKDKEKKKKPKHKVVSGGHSYDTMKTTDSEPVKIINSDDSKKDPSIGVSELMPAEAPKEAPKDPNEYDCSKLCSKQKEPSIAPEPSTSTKNASLSNKSELSVNNFPTVELRGCEKPCIMCKNASVATMGDCSFFAAPVGMDCGCLEMREKLPEKVSETPAASKASKESKIDSKKESKTEVPRKAALPGNKCFPDTCGITPDETALEVRYATTIISNFEKYTTYEILKSSLDKPKNIKNVTEGVFVVRRVLPKKKKKTSIA